MGPRVRGDDGRQARRGGAPCQSGIGHLGCGHGEDAAVAQLVRALGCGPRGRWFESTQLYQMRPVPCSRDDPLLMSCVWQQSVLRP
jgi:hypothetical protein